jgi:hypothetical protein
MSLDHDSGSDAIEIPTGPSSSDEGQVKQPAREDQETRENKTKKFVDAMWSGSDADIKAAFRERVEDLFEKFPNLNRDYLVLALFEPLNSIDDSDLDSVFRSLKQSNPEKSKNVCLILLSRGGSIEPAYQISKLCKQWSSSKFVVVIPRYAKSAATLIALGADEIHIGPLGQLGPIDPQLGGLPALGVSQALQTIAQLAEKFPGSATMFAEYLKRVLTVEQIGYCDRIAQSASQYAHRLLATKPSIAGRVETIANRLVVEYKDHAFVIDIDESRSLLGEELVKSGTAELEFAEALYQLFDDSNFWLKFHNKKLLITGDPAENIIIFERQRK